LQLHGVPLATAEGFVNWQYAPLSTMQEMIEYSGTLGIGAGWPVGIGAPGIGGTGGGGGIGIGACACL
jgi:hypothetical protein